ncbi:MAG: PKD domain-containing protein [Bacteroidetes bacterium]|nr:MAG: PKD domain-containing protein [Bacteroidota bacterium]
MTLRISLLLPRLGFLLAFLSIIGLAPLRAQSESTRALIDTYLQRQAPELGLQPGDIAQWEITDEVPSQAPGLTHYYLRQTYQGIPVYNGVANLAIQNGQVVHAGLRLQADLATRAHTTRPTLGPEQAIAAAARALELPGQDVHFLEAGGPGSYRYSGGNLSRSDIPVQLMYLPGPEGELTLVWDLSLELPDGSHWWSLRLDAQSGQVLDQTDWILRCAFPEHAFHGPHTHAFPVPAPLQPAAPAQIQSGGAYHVFAFDIESPNHGPRTLQVAPEDSLASPFGWHDTDGQTGPEFTITRGNNVYASEDRNADNTPGYSPDGGPTLNFDYPLNLNQVASGYEDASITNLFYLNNIMHDVWYHYGFDEASGNFQANNYGRGGVGGDYVNADAQDGGGINNANFGTPPDGGNPRMQMFLWASGSGPDSLLTVSSPASIAGSYIATEATFGPGVSTPITADVVLVDDATNPNPNDGCETLINSAALNGKIALIDRGNCNFTFKVEAAQNAGAVAVIIANNVAGSPITMGGFSSTITIPSIMISQADGQAIKARLAAGDTVNATLGNASQNFDRDGSFDNGIIAHEYTHGISIRLTGGGSNVNCLNNAEQMGEGWSDWFGLMLSFDPNQQDRGIGTFAIDEPITGVGIRNARYSPSLVINPYTYANTNNVSNVSQPHGIGFVWCTMLWDLSLEFVDTYGYDSLLIGGNGGNNMVMSLVTEALKLQPCSPGFVDGRDAILAADQILFGGANECMIWEVFARRGLGVNASQGSTASRTDQVEDFELPAICMIPVTPPSSAFAFQATGGCGNRFTFTDQSTDVPQQWQWDFGDGNGDTTRHTEHEFAASGTYTVTLIVTNTLGSDTSVQQVTVTLPPAPSGIPGQQVCVGDSVLLSASQAGTYEWFDAGGFLLDTGLVFQFPPLSGDTSVWVGQILTSPAQMGGPVDGSIGPGGYHNTGFTGTLNFTAQGAFTLESAWLDAGSAGTRTIFLWDNINGSGNIVDQITLNIPAGPQRVTLDLEIPGPGTYSVGGTNVNLYRNSSGANYPYVVTGLLSINSSSATTGPQDFYYYLYDWEVQPPSCKSDRVEVPVAVAQAGFELAQSTANAPEVSFTDLSTGATSWLWDFGDGNSDTTQNPVHQYQTSGQYVVTLTVNGSCIAIDTVETWAVGLEALRPGLEVSLHPNPAQNLTTLQLSEALPEDLKLRLYAADGRLVRQQALPQGQVTSTLPLSQLSAGVYLLELSADRHRAFLRLVVQP